MACALLAGPAMMAKVARAPIASTESPDAQTVPAGGRWLVDPVGTSPQFTGAEFTDEDLLYATAAEDFVRGEVLTRLEDLERKEEGLMVRLLKRAGELGLLMIDVPERFGGLGLAKTTSMLVCERSALCGSFSVSWGAHTGIGSLPLVYYGTDAQRSRYLPRLATGEWLAAYALTEPGAGSDALAARTRALPADPAGRVSLSVTRPQSKVPARPSFWRCRFRDARRGRRLVCSAWRVFPE